MGCPERSRSKRKPTLKNEKLHSFLLELPVNLVRTLAEFLNPVDLALFSQTCSAIYNTLEMYGILPRLSRIDYTSYLAIRARGIPDQWACEICNKLHPVCRRDTPTSLLHRSSCPRRKSMDTFYPQRNFYLWRNHHSRKFQLQHHHVQLALKYSRLQEAEYNPYLKELMRRLCSSQHGLLQTWKEAHPKIVTDRDGNPRFLMFSSWRYNGRSSRDPVWMEVSLRVCPHLEIDLHGKRGDPGDWSVSSPWGDDTLLFEWLNCGERTIGACRRCATDYEVYYGGDFFLDIMVWQDFGIEGNSALDLIWKNHTFCAREPFEDSNPGSFGPGLYHKPGSIRDLYGPIPRLIWR
ncbi:hypothetical protein GGR51DRAFT_561883 [Nemania sp. FL0031]|nr:hypothetical protein GGR51DRAFT_561883 [Nemania sp. FL0031]